MFGPSTLVTRIIMTAVIVILLLGFLQVRSCSNARQKAAEARVERAQTKAVVESAKDAIATQGVAQARERASGELTERNREEITDAKGADILIDPGVSDAGLRALCRRASYRDSERCRMYRAAASGVAAGRGGS